MTEDTDVMVFSGKVVVRKSSNLSYQWPDWAWEDYDIAFQKAYEIEHTDWDEGIMGCRYRVQGRDFTDLSCMRGRTLRRYPDGYEVRKHADGTRFLYYHTDIPTFDFGDMEWDSTCCVALYGNDKGINLICCNYGFQIPRIKVYIGLCKPTPSITKWLKILGCEDKLESTDTF